MSQALRIAWTLQTAAFRGQMQYRLNFAVSLAMGVVYQVSGLASIWVILHHFHTIDGWDFTEITLLYAIRLAAHATFVVPFNQLDFVEGQIRDGRFDRFLVRPLNPLLQVMTGGFELNVFGDLMAAAVLLGFSMWTARVEWSPLHLLYLALAIVGGALAEAAVLLVMAGLSFRFLQTWAGQYLVDNLFLMFGSYPLRIFGNATSWALTWLLPVAFVAYVPASVLFGRTGELRMPAFLAWGAPVVGLVWFAIAYRVWQRLLDSYQSSGH